MGPVFAETFPAAYTRKYWTTEPSNLDTDWIGTRVLKPEVDDVVNGAAGPLPRATYYVAGPRRALPDCVAASWGTRTRWPRVPTSGTASASSRSISPLAP